MVAVKNEVNKINEVPKKISEKTIGANAGAKKLGNGSGLLLLWIGLSLSACGGGGGKEDLSSYFPSRADIPSQIDVPASTPTGDPTTPPAGSSTQPTTDTEATVAGAPNHFAIGLKAGTTIKHRLHEAGFAADECKILRGSTERNVECQIEVSETDIFAQGLSLHVSVPPKMCDYVRFQNYYYYNFEIGKAASDLVVEKTLKADGSIESLDCVIDGKRFNNCLGGKATLPNRDDKEIYFDELGDPFCVYNHSVDNTFQPNCCFGNRKITTITTTVDPLGAIVSQNTDIDRGNWGGSYEACMGGPAITDSSWPKSKSGFPNNYLYTTLEEGVNFIYDLVAPIEGTSFNNLTIANYFTRPNASGTSPHARTRSLARSGISPPESFTSSLPEAINPIADRGAIVNREGYSATRFGYNSLLPFGHDAYSFSCLDSASEVIYKIDLYIREWNTQNEFLNYLSDPQIINILADQGTNGIEGSDCGYYPSLSVCNDYFDWDDKANSGNPYPQHID